MPMEKYFVSQNSQYSNYILIVEDNEDDIALTRRALSKSDIQSDVVIARDGQEAIDYLLGKENSGEEISTTKDSNLPLFVLLDLNMPRVNGLEVIKRVRSHPRTQSLPIVVLTTSDERSDVINSYKFGANSYVRKPLDNNQFVAAIQCLHLYWKEHNVPPPH